MIPMCASWPQACIRPSAPDAKLTPESSWIGRASMSARSITVLPGLPVSSSATTPVSVGQRCSWSPSERSRSPRYVLAEADLGPAVEITSELDHLLDHRAARQRRRRLLLTHWIDTRL